MLGLQWAPDAKYWHQLWSVRIALAGAGLTGLASALPVFQNFMSPYLFAFLTCLISIATLAARLTDQKSVPTS